jgi:glycosyltransferase involved in cell wall biosynthesis
MKLAYLVGRYPAATHTFIAREILELRARGFEIETISVHATPESEMRTDGERDERRRTVNVLPTSAGTLIRAHFRAFVSSPASYVRTLIAALRMSPTGLKAHIWQLFYFAEAMIVRRYCMDRGIRHLHAQFTSQVTDIALLIAAFENGRGAPLTWSFTVHGPDEFYEVSRFNLAEKVERATFVVCISDFARSQLMTLASEDAWDKLFVVHCGLDPSQFDAGRSNEPSDDFRVLCVGRLVPVKGQRLLIAAAEGLASRGVRPRLTFVGGGPSEEELRRLAERSPLAERIRFAGVVGQDEIRDLYGDADVVALPSFAEGVPVVLMEAMSMEIPVVTSRIMGIPELVEDGVSGLLVPPGSVEALTDALGRLAADPKLRQALGARGRDKVAADFAIADTAVRLAEIFDAHAARV